MGRIAWQQFGVVQIAVGLTVGVLLGSLVTDATILEILPGALLSVGVVVALHRSREKRRRADEPDA